MVYHIISDKRVNEYIPSRPLIGLGFFNSGGESLIYGISSFKSLFTEGAGADFTCLIPGTYTVGKGILALFLILAPLLEQFMGKTKNQKKEAIIFISVAIIFGGGVAGLVFLIFFVQNQR